MRISILFVLGCQFKDLDFNNNRNTGHVDKRKIQKVSMKLFLFAKNCFLFQFHVNLELYVLGNQIRVNFIDFNFIDLNFLWKSFSSLKVVDLLFR